VRSSLDARRAAGGGCVEIRRDAGVSVPAVPNRSILATKTNAQDSALAIQPSIPRYWAVGYPFSAVATQECANATENKNCRVHGVATIPALFESGLRPARTR
jgi:hypothetical protein